LRFLGLGLLQVFPSRLTHSITRSSRVYHNVRHCHPSHARACGMFIPLRHYRIHKRLQFNCIIPSRIYTTYLMFAHWFWLHLGLGLRKFPALILEESEFPAVKTLFVLRLALRAFGPMTLPPTSIAYYSRPVWLHVSRRTSSPSSRCVFTLGTRNRIHWVQHIVIINSLLLPSHVRNMGPQYLKEFCFSKRCFWSQVLCFKEFVL